MAGNHLRRLLAVLLLLLLSQTIANPYLSPDTLHRDYPRMLKNFKIFAYPCDQPNPATFKPESPSNLFHSLIESSPFLTRNPDQADLFYVSFSGSGPRSISKSVKRIRLEFPYWNRTLGSDHFFVSELGIGESSDRNLVELRKNSIQIAPFPTTLWKFIPHKDISIPTIETKLDRIRTVHVDETEFCLLDYNGSDVPIGGSIGKGCVLVFISDRPILDLPFSDLIDWSEIALVSFSEELFMRSIGQVGWEKRVRMRESVDRIGSIFKWDVNKFSEGDIEPNDAFHAVLYQLWRRRHVIRYPRWGEGKFVESSC